MLSDAHNIVKNEINKKWVIFIKMCHSREIPRSARDDVGSYGLNNLQQQLADYPLLAEKCFSLNGSGRYGNGHCLNQFD